MEIFEQLSAEFNLRTDYAQNIIDLLDEGCTIPFIARYRKEMHGSCDDQVLREFSDRLNYLRNLQKRKEEVENSIKEQEKWTEELEVALKNAKTLTEVEDIYRPYKPKRKTRASVAIAKGLEPLADIIQAQTTTEDLLQLASEYINEEKEVKTAEEALAGAKDIIAERVSDDAELRKILRELIKEHALLKTTLLEKEGNEVYDMYADRSETVKTLPSHRILAINRGEKEDCLKVELLLDETLALNAIEKEWIIEGSTTKETMQEVIADRNIKMKQVKTMQYLLENIKKQDTIFIKDTIFINKDFVLDTCKIDEWSEICLHLEYPNVISVNATFNNEKYITTSVRKEPIKKRKWFLPRWFTRKQEIITIDVYDKNPYVKTPQQRYVEIIK
jgi:transcriptional accessory protein Tex/SPT6